MIAEATAFREQFGLRADEAWIVAVELDPRASSEEFGIRLLPNEIADLEGRAENAEAVAPVVRAYGLEHANVFGGSYIDQLRSGLVVVLFTDDPSLHEAALRKLLHPSARWVVRKVQFSEADLEALHARIAQDREWFDSVGATLGSIATDVARNRVELVYFSLDPMASDVIRAHFNTGDMLRVVHNADPVAFLPRGALRGRVESKSGQPVADLLINAIGEIANAEPDGGVAFGTSSDGSFFIPRLAAMDWEIQALAGIPDGDWRLLGKATVTVKEDATAFVVITVP